MCTVVTLAFLIPSMPSGRLSHLQGVCVPRVHFCGYWGYGMLFVLATSVIRGQHPHPGEPISASAGMAVKVRTQWLEYVRFLPVNVFSEGGSINLTACITAVRRPVSSSTSQVT
jgi:hypothetical protein